MCRFRGDLEEAVPVRGVASHGDVQALAIDGQVRDAGRTTELIGLFRVMVWPAIALLNWICRSTKPNQSPGAATRGHRHWC